jgi:putative ABC transport system permease protein
MKALNIKLLRELWKLRMQMLSIALVVATGIMSVITMRGTYDSLVIAQQNYYAESRFADLWAPLVRAPLTLVEKIENIPGVEKVDSRVTLLAKLDLEDLDMPAQGRFVSVPVDARPVLNDINIRQGRYLNQGYSDEVIISEKFALARDLSPGDNIRVVINGRSRELDIVGVANSPEHSYAVPPGSLFPEDERYGVFWMGRETLAAAFDMDGAFNELVATLTPNANPEAVMRGVDEILEPFGGLGSYLREDQLSHQILENELAENRIMGTAIPAIFLGVAVFLLHLVLGRLITTQRGEIAVLKAFGYSNREVGSHFLMFALVAVLLGALIGSVGGAYLGKAMISLYRQYFDIPDLEYTLTFPLLFIAFVVSVTGACTGAVSAVKRAVNLPPAEAMRPEAPARFRPGPIESLGLGKLLSSAGRMILRNTERKPVQTLLSAVGVAMSLAILLVGMFMFDSITYMMDLQFRTIQREDITLTFREVVPEGAYFNLSHIEGVTRVETYNSIAARLRSGQFEEEIVVQGLEPQSVLRRIINANGDELPVPDSGIIISSLLAKRLRLNSGDVVDVEWLEGKRNKNKLKISGIVDDFIGVSAFMSKAALNKASGESSLISGAHLSVDDQHMDSVYAELKQIPAVAGVAAPETMLASFEKELAESILISAGFLVAFASIIAIGVIYNGARISLSERGRELASLRVLGFHRREVATLLLGEQTLVTLLAIPVGYFIGYTLSNTIASSIETDAYRIPFIIDMQTYLIATLIIIIAAFASGWAVRRRLDNFDLVAVLKTRE